MEENKEILKKRVTYTVNLNSPTLGVHAEKEIDGTELRMVYNELKTVTSAIAKELGVIETMIAPRMPTYHPGETEEQVLRFAELKKTPTGYGLFPIKEASLHIGKAENTVSAVCADLFQQKKLGRVKAKSETNTRIFQYFYIKPPEKKQVAPSIETETDLSKSLEKTAEEKAKENERLRDAAH